MLLVMVPTADAGQGQGLANLLEVLLRVVVRGMSRRGRGGRARDTISFATSTSPGGRGISPFYGMGMEAVV